MYFITGVKFTMGSRPAPNMHKHSYKKTPTVHLYGFTLITFMFYELLE